MFDLRQLHKGKTKKNTFPLEKIRGFSEKLKTLLYIRTHNLAIYSYEGATCTGLEGVTSKGKNSLDCLLEDQHFQGLPGSQAVKSKSNSLPKSAFSNIQLRVQEIRDQLEVLKASSHSSGSKALQQVLPRIRPPTLNSDYLDEGFEEVNKINNANKLCTPVYPHNPLYSLVAAAESGHADLGTERKLRPGFLNNRPLSMPSPPMAASPDHSPNSMSPRSLSPNTQLSPKHNIRPSSCYNANIHTSTKGDRGGLRNSFPSPPSSPSTLSPCSSNSLPSSQVSH